MENKFTRIKYRVLQIAEHYQINKEKFFKKISMTSANFRGNAKETPLNSNAIENIITNYPEINLQWLLTGEGEMLNHSVTKNVAESTEKDKLIEFLQKTVTHLIQQAEQKDDEIKKLKSELSMLEERYKKKKVIAK